MQVSFPHAKHMLVTTLYRPPNATVAWYNDFDVFMDQLTAQECELVLMGDINIDIIQGLHTAPPAWQDIINNHQMSQLVQDPTRVTENTETLIDHIYDHYPVCFVRQLNASDVRKHGHTTIKYRSYKHFDIGSVPWSIIEMFDDVDDALHAWEMLFMDVVKVHVPLRERRVKRLRQPGWLTDDITAAMSTRDSHKQRKYTYTTNYVATRLCK